MSGEIQSGELFNVRGHVYRVAGFNAYGQAMLEEIRFPTDAERARAISTVDLLKLAAASRPAADTPKDES